jgi:hypothetical protein
MRRRTLLSTVGAVAFAGCSTTGRPAGTETSTPTPEPDATVTFASMYGGHAIDKETFETDYTEEIYQISATLEETTGPVTRVDATVITGEGSQTGTWLLPEQLGESRTLGSRNLYDEDDVVNPEPGDWIEVRVWAKGRTWIVDRRELSGDGGDD